MALAQRRNAMTTLGKTMFVALSLAALIAGTLLLRNAPEPAALGQLTPAQMAELQPAAKAAEPPKTVRPQEATDASAPQEPDLEDGSGS
jgi:hypothetical protein